MTGGRNVRTEAGDRGRFRSPASIFQNSRPSAELVMYRALRFPLLLTLVLLAPSLASAQGSPPPSGRVNLLGNGRVVGTIDGIVSDTNLVPLQGAFISVLGTAIRVGTGPNGRFRITKVPVGQYLLIVKRVGYKPTSAVVDVPATDTLRLAYTLEQVG